MSNPRATPDHEQLPALPCNVGRGPPDSSEEPDASAWADDEGPPTKAFNSTMVNYTVDVRSTWCWQYPPAAPQDIVAEPGKGQIRLVVIFEARHLPRCF